MQSSRPKAHKRIHTHTSKSNNQTPPLPPFNYHPAHSKQDKERNSNTLSPHTLTYIHTLSLYLSTSLDLSRPLSTSV